MLNATSFISFSICVELKFKWFQDFRTAWLLTPKRVTLPSSLIASKKILQFNMSYISKMISSKTSNIVYNVHNSFLNSRRYILLQYGTEFSLFFCHYGNVVMRKETHKGWEIEELQIKLGDSVGKAENKLLLLKGSRTCVLN